MQLDTRAWPGLRLVEQVTEGNRNLVWRGDLDGQKVAVRLSRRDPDSLEWELALIARLAARGFRVPTIHTTSSGAQSANGVVVQSWLEGRSPHTRQDWQAVAEELQRMHSATTSYPQRPGCCVCDRTRDAAP